MFQDISLYLWSTFGKYHLLLSFKFALNTCKKTWNGAVQCIENQASFHIQNANYVCLQTHCECVFAKLCVFLVNSAGSHRRHVVYG